jgi:hypothetical protein
LSVSLLPIVRITVSELRRIFNEERFVERAERGEIKAVVVHSGTPSLDVGLPLGSVSQLISYRDINNLEIARAHQYLLPDGRIGASGKPDPKRVLKDGKLYRLQKKFESPVNALR